MRKTNGPAKGRASILTALGALFLLGACTDQDCWEADDEQLREQVKNLPLEELYAYHVRLCKACIPTRTTLAWDIAERGEPAKRLALFRSRTDDVGEFRAALGVIDAYNNLNEIGCAPKELRRLEANAASLQGVSAEPATLREDIASACARERRDVIQL